MTRNVFAYYKRLIGLVVTMTLAVLAAAGTAWGQNESFKMLASDGEAFDQFGLSVAIDGDTAILGAPRTDDNDSDDSGSAYIFQ